MERLYGEMNEIQQLDEKLKLEQYTGSSMTHQATPSTPVIESTPAIIKEKIYEAKDEFQVIEEEEESLSISETEKKLIKKALAKHNGKRKYAAEDLGISERTLYRKIKEYEIEQ